ncbi:matrixin family metalloprotease, partial [Actinophytocola xanthii]
ALPAIKSATTTLFTASSRCGTATTQVTQDIYAGTSTKAAQVSPQGTCTGNDNVSVTSWGTLPASVLAYTCVYYRTGSKTVLSSDVLIDNKVHKWFTTQPAGCTNQFDLESVMVHERGHTAGLEHVAQNSAQTMTPKTPACTTA